MAGDWLKVEKDTPDKPEVLAIAAKLSITPDEAFGKCFRIWRWFDSHTTEGNAASVTTSLLDALVNRSGFGDALVSVGWLASNESGLQVPNFGRHMGQSAKQRGLTAKRVADFKKKSNAKGNAPIVTDALPREEKRREDINTPLIPQGGTKDHTTDPQFQLFWKAYPKKRRSGPKAAYRKWKAAVIELRHREGTPTTTAAAEWLHDRCVAYARSAEGRGEFVVGPSVWLNQGRYDDADETWNAGSQQEAPRCRPLTREELEHVGPIQP